MNPPVLHMKGISKRFPGVVALDAVDLEVGAGEVVALVGENGAGKSTLMKILGGVYRPDLGEIEIDGQPVTIYSVRDALRLGVGFIHQELNVIDNLDVAGNVFLGREPLRGGFLRLIDHRRMCAATDVCLKRLGLDVASRAPLASLSIAQRQLIEIAKALSQNARILIMDEPTSSLTLTETARLLDVIRELKAQGVSVIYISHRLSEVEEIADRVVVLRDGRPAGTLARGEVTHERLVRLMVGRDIQRPDSRPSHANRPPYFAVRNLRTRRYPSREVSFAVARGEVLGVAGLIGAGRTEVARAIFGVEAAVGGSVLLDGVELKISSPADAIAHGIYLIPEDRRGTGLIVDFMIRANITLPALERYADAGLIKRGRERAAAVEWCGRLNVKAPSIEARAADLSGGNQQKVVLAKWLSLNPRVLIFDEPTRGIDVGAKAEIYELMRGLAVGGVSVVMISSDMEEIINNSDRVAVMHEGRVAGILNQGECNEQAIMRLAVGRTEEPLEPSARSVVN
ncbi:MAG: sugar ABC transporter ATP-binding protein [Acidobacteriota bacterium]|nr:sugar ABC transporter ATP-binding protein [Acidobacteriota bacterium]